MSKKVVDAKEKRKESWIENPLLFIEALWTAKSHRKEIHFSGSLIFWDVFPKLEDNQLGIDILNPHYSHYYQKGQPPHEAGQPVPNFFLTVPPGSSFTFHVECKPNRLPNSLAAKWKELLDAAFRHVFGWSGFGAKTAVGYGVLDPDQEAERQLNEKRAQLKEKAAAKRREQELASLPEAERLLREFEGLLKKEMAINRRDINGPLPNAYSELRRKSEPWEQEYRNRLADFAEQLWDFLGWGKKEKERREVIRKLRELPQTE